MSAMEEEKLIQKLRAARSMLDEKLIQEDDYNDVKINIKILMQSSSSIVNNNNTNNNTNHHNNNNMENMPAL